jgi:hypothetical protein
MMPVAMQGAAGTMARPNAMAGMGGMGPAGGTGGAMQPVTPPGEPIERGDEPTEASASRMGPYSVESYTSGFRAPMDYGGGAIWYPTDADPPFAIVAVCPGFTASQLQIANWGPFLASHGIVTMPLDSVDQRAPALMDALGTVQDENARGDSPLLGKLDTMRISPATTTSATIQPTTVERSAATASRGRRSSSRATRVIEILLVEGPGASEFRTNVK